MSEDREREGGCVSPEPLLQILSMHLPSLGVICLILKDGFHLPGRLFNGFKWNSNFSLCLKV